MKKKIRILIFITFILLKNIIAQIFPITANILRQVYVIQTDTLQGTCFLIEYNNKEYLLTAKHLFRPSLINGSTTRIDIYQENKIRNFNAKYYIHTDTTIDIAVLKITQSLKVTQPFPIEGFSTLGQDVYFLGYPSLNNINFATYSKSIGTFPLVKKGIISGMVEINNYNLYYIDGHNNPGFSGGPAICYDYSNKRNIIFGVISGYYYENKPVKNKLDDVKNSFIQENAGIIKCFPASVAVQIIANIK